MNRPAFTANQSQFTMNRPAFTANQSQFIMNRPAFTANQSRFTVNWGRRPPQLRAGGSRAPRISSGAKLARMGQRGEGLSRQTAAAIHRFPAAVAAANTSSGDPYGQSAATPPS